MALTRRRTLLAGAALGGTALISGCSEDAGERRHDGGTGRVAAAGRLRERAARDSAALLARYDATLAAHPALGDRLRPLRAEVARHAEAFGAAVPPGGPSATPSGRPGGTAGSGTGGGPSKTPSAGPTDSAGSAGSTGSVGATASAGPSRTPEVPRDERQARAALADAERRTADARTAALADAPAELARLLASVAAAGAAHAYLLTEGGT
ncbi:hypothetical protein [Streptomyces sp. MST-110588]|uniref:hypothetical protein n=1 Tax=Streptomyces sp. MST-110588 TaxID=2833628 RepID=UPI001F5C1A5B|nr:hypothetical protein [Streptomyces sp. MST-110588]UNO39664.1 hypothetical protein KGS77_08700 [Streptomyces sp. MST-110588]